MIYNIFTSPYRIGFWPLHYIPLFFIYTEIDIWELPTNLIQSKQNPTISNKAHKCVTSLFLEKHKHFRAKGSGSDHAFWQSLPLFKRRSCDPLRDPIPDYPPQLQEMENDFIMCLMREAMERVWSVLSVRNTPTFNTNRHKLWSWAHTMAIVTLDKNVLHIKIHWQNKWNSKTK